MSQTYTLLYRGMWSICSMAGLKANKGIGHSPESETSSAGKTFSQPCLADTAATVDQDIE